MVLSIAVALAQGARIFRQADGNGQQQLGSGQSGQQARCFIGDKSIQVNETAVVNNLVFLCQPNGIRITGCVFTDDNGKLIQTKVGESVAVGGITHKCGGLTNPGQGGSAQGGNSTAGNTASPQSNQPCTYDGKEHKDNETWTAKSFRYRCKNGDVDIVACIIDDKNELPVGQNAVKFGLLHHCIKEGNRISYRSEICGVGKVNCDPSVVGNTNTNVNNGQSSSASSAGGQVASGSSAPSGSPAPTGTSGTSTNGNGTETTCLKDGQIHATESTWVANNFKYNCHKDGSISIDACVTDSGKELGLGEVWVLGGLQHTCSQRRNGAGYSTQLCGSQVQCGPDGLQQQKEQKAQLPPSSVQTTEASLPRVQPVQ
jgi:hypothetical protein